MEADWSKPQSNVFPNNSCSINEVVIIASDYTVTSKDDDITLYDDGTISLPPGTYDVTFSCNPVNGGANGAGCVLYNALLGGIVGRSGSITYTNICTSTSGQAKCQVNSLYWSGKIWNATLGSNGGKLYFVIADLYQIKVGTFSGHISITKVSSVCK